MKNLYLNIFMVSIISGSSALASDMNKENLGETGSGATMTFKEKMQASQAEVRKKYAEKLEKEQNQAVQEKREEYIKHQSIKDETDSMMEKLDKGQILDMMAEIWSRQESREYADPRESFRQITQQAIEVKKDIALQKFYFLSRIIQFPHNKMTNMYNYLISKTLENRVKLCQDILINYGDSFYLNKKLAMPIVSYKKQLEENNKSLEVYEKQYVQALTDLVGKKDEKIVALEQYLQDTRDLMVAKESSLLRLLP